VAGNTGVETLEDQSPTAPVPATEADGDGLSFSVLTGPAHGTLGFNGDGSGDTDGITLRGPAPSPITHTPIDATPGTLSVGGPLSSDTGLEPTTIDAAVDELMSVFGGGDDDVTPETGAPTPTISSPSRETVTFMNPTGVGRVEAGAGNVTITGSGQVRRDGDQGPDLLLGGRGRDLSIDWSRAWGGWGNGHHRGKELKSAWLKPFLLDLGEEDPNLGIEVVLAEPELAHAPANGHNGNGARRNR
jgi:hypothetical protein